MQHFRSLFDLDENSLDVILQAATEIKSQLYDGKRPEILKNRVIALLFEKPSLRTRVSFETGMAQMGGNSLFLGEDVGWGKREPLADFTRVIGEFVDAVVCRTKSHDLVVQMAGFDSVPIVNGLTNLCHPCQAIADALTIKESLGELSGKRLVFVGDGNNVSHSLALVSAMTGMDFVLARPDGYALDPSWIQLIRDRYPNASITESSDPMAAVSSADVIYTDVWTSMGQEAESAKRRKDFADFQVNESMIEHAADHVRVLHCLPAIRGEEITDEVMEGPHSDIIQQAGNRMHAQKALLVWMLNRDWITENV